MLNSRSHQRRSSLFDFVPFYPDAGSDNEDSDAHSVASGSIFSPPPTVSSVTSYDRDSSMRSASPVPSVISMSSSFVAAAYRLEHGRGLNNYSDVYTLAADDEELDRLEKQHRLFIEVMGKYPPPIYEVLVDDVPGEPKAILDLGCGGGHWILDAARDFPNANCVAVDLVPMQQEGMPPNCRSEVDDINLGLQHFFGDFNYVHARLISSGITDYPSLIGQISDVLRPGGLVELVEFDFHMYDENFQRIELSTNVLTRPWWPQWLAFANEAIIKRGGSVDAATHLHRWISENPKFEDIVSFDYWIPCSPWMEEQPMRHYGEEMREDILAFMQSGRPLLLAHGLPESFTDELEFRARDELYKNREKTYVRVQRVYARKIRGSP